MSIKIKQKQVNDHLIIWKDTKGKASQFSCSHHMVKIHSKLLGGNPYVSSFEVKTKD